MTPRRATLIGFSAVLLWSSLALLTVGSAPVPPLLLNAMTFAIGGAIGLVWTARQGFERLRGVPVRVYLLGSVALFGYHALYFSALRMAPPAEAGLIAYLWPLLIVLGSGLLPGESLRAGHVLGAVLAFAGAALIVARAGVTFEGGSMAGYGLAFLAALTWAGYSLASRRAGAIPTESVAIFCLLTAALSGVMHLLMEETVLPTSPLGWISVIALGLGPVGLAFYTWDIGMKRGNVQILGVASYAAPLLSTLALTIAGVTPATPTLLVAAALIAGGAAVAARAGGKSPD